MLTDSQIAWVKEQGYLVLDPFLTAAELDEVLHTLDQIVDQARSMSSGNDVIELLAGHSAERPLIRKIKKPALRYPVFDRLRRHPKTLAIMEQLIGPDVLCQRHKINVKPSRVGEEFPWHQDWAYLPYTNDSIYHFAIALDAVSLDNGGVRVIPGSHRGPLYDHHRDGVFVGGVDRSLIDETRAVPLEVKAGGAFLFHTRTLHHSPRNTSERPRHVLFFEYTAGDAWPLLGISDWNAYAAAFVLGKPTLEPRCSDVPRRLPFPGLRGKMQKL